MKSRQKIWQHKASSEDYKAAEKYLRLLFRRSVARRLVRGLRAAPTEYYEAKDLLRASQTHLLDEDNHHVARDMKKIKKGQKLSPVLLVCGAGGVGATLTIADGYHRICASWHWNEDTPIACCLAELPSQGPRTQR